MFKKYFKVDLVTVDSTRIVVHVEADDVREVVARMKGNRLTFIPRTKENHHTFTVYAHLIGRVQYETVTNTGFGNVLIYDILAD